MKNIVIASMTALTLSLATVPTFAAGDASTSSGSAGQFVDDATVTTKVKAALAKDDITKARNIKVETTKGVVLLTGKVDSQREIDQATKVAHSVEGAASVTNKLTTK